MMESIKMIAISVIAACIYGIANDLVTAHVCVEYFLPPAHPIVIPTHSPLLLALLWGVIATWWVGLLLGVPLAIVCRVGQKPKLATKDVARPILLLIVFLYVTSMLLGCIGYVAGRMKWVWLLPPLSQAAVMYREIRFKLKSRLSETMIKT